MVSSMEFERVVGVGILIESSQVCVSWTRPEHTELHWLGMSLLSISCCATLSAESARARRIDGACMMVYGVLSYVERYVSDDCSSRYGNSMVLMIELYFERNPFSLYIALNSKKN
jgi:hypothetical protein